MEVIVSLSFLAFSLESCMYKCSQSLLFEDIPQNFQTLFFAQLEKMMQPELSQLSWQCFNNLGLSFGEIGVHGPDMDMDMSYCDLSPPFTITDDSFDNFPIPHSPALFSNEFMVFPFDQLQDAVEAGHCPPNLDEFDPISGSDVEDIWGYLEESEGCSPSHQLSIEGEDEWSCSACASKNSSDTAMDIISVQPSIRFPSEDMEIDNQVLVKAYGEAMENEQKDLADVIMKRISEKVSPVDEIGDRLLYYSFQNSDQEADYLKQESLKNFNAAFKVIYQNFPHGRIAHFRANAAILEAMPHDAETIRIIDFDMGEGVQWSMVIEAIGQQHQQQQQKCHVFQQKLLRLTSIKWNEEDRGCTALPWRFEETKRRLCDHARSFGLKLKVDEIELQELVSEIKKTKKRDGKEWLAFNCMLGLPHMGRVRSREHVMEFLRIAKDFLHNSPPCSTSNRGIMTFGEGDFWENTKNCSGFMSFFDGYMSHYNALLESLEWNFPKLLAEARTTMESLFVAPYVSHTALSQKWAELKEGYNTEPGVGLGGCGVSLESFMEAQEIVREGESLYRVRIEGENNNQMVLDWRGTALIRVSTWV